MALTILGVGVGALPASAHDGDRGESAATTASAPAAPGSIGSGAMVSTDGDAQGPHSTSPEQLPPPPIPYLLPTIDLPALPRPLGAAELTGTLVHVASGSSDHVIAPLLMTDDGRGYSLVGARIDGIDPGAEVRIRGTAYPRGSITSLRTAGRSDIAVTGVRIIAPAPVMTGSQGTRKVFVAALSWPEMPAPALATRDCSDVGWLAEPDLCQTDQMEAIDSWSQSASDGVFTWEVTAVDLALANQPACDDMAWRSATVTAAADAGYDLVNGDFSALALLMPPGIDTDNCLPTAYAYVGSGTWNIDPWWSLSVYGFGYSFKQVLVHELGHSLGLPHANNATCTQAAVAVSMTYVGSCIHHEYGDSFDPMGSAFTNSMYNPIFARDLGWTPAEDRVAVTPFKDGLAAGSRSFMLAGYADINAGVRVVDVQLPPPTTGDLAGQSPGMLYVEYKRQIGIDSEFQWWNQPEDKVYLHWRPSCAVAEALRAGIADRYKWMQCDVSYLVDTVPATTDVEDGGLDPGDSWTDPTGTLTVTFASRASDLSSATVDVSWISSTPAAPSGITLARSGAGAVRVSWSAATDNGHAVRTYRVAASGGGGQGCLTSVAATPDPLTCEVTGLTAGTNYTFDVTAANDMGTGAVGRSSSIVAATTPAAPLAVKAERAGSGALTVSWTPALNSGGVGLTSFAVSAVGGAKTCTAVAPATSCTVSGLVNGNPYAFMVTATNAAGLTSAPSAPSSMVAPAVAPASPTGVTLTRAGSGALKISWTAPGSTGGPPVASYTVTTVTGGRTCTASEPALTCTLTGLTNGTTYRVTVTATNGAGLVSTASAPSAALAPGVVPGKPTQVSAARASSTSIRVTWTAPTQTGGLPLLGFSVTVMGSSKTCTAGAGATSCTLTGLARGSYRVAVVARNAAGTSVASAWTSPTVLRTPSRR